MNFLHQFLSACFGFNKQQRNGLLVLCLIIIILFIVRMSLTVFIKPAPLLMADFSHIQFKENLISAADSSNEKTKTAGALFVFNPNTVSKEQLILLGFKEKAANTFINYRNKGAQFHKKEDLKKVYGISEKLYNSLSPYIFIESANENKKQQDKTENKTEIKNTKPEINIIELNSADSISLLSLKGIGPGFTKRILKYRNSLGGFYSVNQLSEVYGMDDALFQSIKNNVSVNAGNITKLNINNENFKELNKHPYLGYENVKAIFNYRRKNGSIYSMAQLKEIIIDEEVIKKLTPYLSLE